jgi:hypothetical protein
MTRKARLDVVSSLAWLMKTHLLQVKNKTLNPLHYTHSQPAARVACVAVAATGRS